MTVFVANSHRNLGAYVGLVKFVFIVNRVRDRLAIAQPLIVQRAHAVDVVKGANSGQRFAFFGCPSDRYTTRRIIVDVGDFAGLGREFFVMARIVNIADYHGHNAANIFFGQVISFAGCAINVFTIALPLIGERSAVQTVGIFDCRRICRQSPALFGIACDRHIACWRSVNIQRRDILVTGQNRQIINGLIIAIRIDYKRQIVDCKDIAVTGIVIIRVIRLV